MKENLHSNQSDMPTIIEIKNKINWLVTFITSVGLLILFCIILIIISIGLLQASFIPFMLPFGALFIFVLYIWLWNNFGKTVLTIDPETVKVEYKNKLFTSPKTYLKKDIDHVETKDFTIETSKYRVRYNFSLSQSTYAVVFTTKDQEIRIIDWIKQEKADEIVDLINKTQHNV
ncbi:hypothetical protein [Chryseobacterium sp. JV558]|uniref:hypothetical protein n=1 Tax=Chryseobacterium sp. JV558 TaxID=2663236 RepID=UPI00299EFDC3|nr:hypothetical protein [Chryseobacterium sp. JV558]MDW9379932.1 hypothetical protein [Chryseobacterium sp. JV558]